MLSYPSISSTPFPHLPSPRISSPPLPYPTTLLSPTLSHHSLPSPYPLTWCTLPCHLPQPLPSPPLSPPWLPCSTLLSLPYYTLPFPTFPRTPFAPLPSHHPIHSLYPSADVPTLQSLLPHPSHLFPSLPKANLSTLLYSPTPTLLYSPLYYPSPVSPPLPTYLPLHPYHTLCIPYPAPLTLIPLHPLPSHPLPYPVPYPTISLRTLPPLPYYTVGLASTTLPSHPLPTYPRTPILPLHSLPSTPSHSFPNIPCPVPYPNISR